MKTKSTITFKAADQAHPTLNDVQPGTFFALVDANDGFGVYVKTSRWNSRGNQDNPRITQWEVVAITGGAPYFLDGTITVRVLDVAFTPAA